MFVRLRRPVSVWCAIVVVLAAVTGCSTPVPGNGAAAPIRRAGQVQSSRQLARFLLPLPAGTKHGVSAWGLDETPTIDEAARQVYSSGSSAARYLRKLGVVGVAHRTWYRDDDGHGADVLLFLFGAARQASTWKSEIDVQLSQQGNLTIGLPGLSDVAGFVFTHSAGPASDTRYVAVRGRVAMMLDYFNVGPADRHPADTWVGGQYRLLA